jgi:omega-hydroxy-beta-dihydromenaquinone-9 sulfotransferase
MASNKPREWMPRIWEGCDFLAWMRLLARNRFAVGLPYLYIAVVVTLVSACHTVLRLVQDVLYAGAVRRTPVRESPLFILGHWRTGTTLLHELLILDERHSFPTTYECLEPNHFLLTEKLITRRLWFLMPSRRPMDNMAAGWDRPQEDEFALCMMGQPSPYLSIAFPNRPPMDQDALDLESLSPMKRAAWKRAFLRLLRHITFRNPKRLVLKSPTHTCRIRTLLELFPDARFVHIVRDPYVVFPSTVNLWKSLYVTHGLQKPTFAGLEEHVFETFTHMYKKLEEGRRLVEPSRFYELRYEELVQDPLGEMRRLYEHLGLGGFEKVRPRLEEYLAKNKGYRTNKYELAPEVRAEITRRWGDVIRRYGYAAS